MQETWDQYQDFHFALGVESLDSIAYLFTRDGVPFITRSFFSLYFEIPGSGFTIQVMAKASTLIWTEPFNFCRLTSGARHWKQLPQPLNIVSSSFLIDTQRWEIMWFVCCLLQSNILANEEPEMPVYSPSHHSYFSARPGKGLEFILRHTTSRKFVPDFNATHRCKWLLECVEIKNQNSTILTL